MRDSTSVQTRSVADQTGRPGQALGTESVADPRAHLAAVGPAERLWAVVLAGGQGLRLRPLTRLVCGDDRPKQYAPIVETQSLLQRTLDRIARAVPVARTLVVTCGDQVHYLVRDLVGRDAPQVVTQPEDRGTAAAILWAAHSVSWREPESVVAVFPSDHFVLQEDVLMEHVAAVAAFVRREPRWLVLLGARPIGPEPGLGWIEPGDLLGMAADEPVWGVRRFWEKPAAEVARACLAAGALWNTFMLVSPVSRLLELGRSQLPVLSDRLARLERFVGTADEAWALRQAFALAPRADFSCEVLEACPDGVAVSRLPPLLWSDWGTPDRVISTLKLLEIHPPWLEQLEARDLLLSAAPTAEDGAMGKVGRFVTDPRAGSYCQAARFRWTAATRSWSATRREASREAR